VKNTLTWLYCIVFGTIEEKEAIARIVNQKHAKVNGPGYSADDPELQLWLISCLFVGSLWAYETVIGPLDDTTAERAYHQMMNLAVSLNIPYAIIPADRQSFWVYWNEEVEMIEVTETSKALSKVVLYPDFAFWA
jgi:uncharacterized protein (DUF2236 family)